MKKSFMNNIKHFVDSNVRQRIDRAANNNNDFFGDDLLLVERKFEDMRHVYVEAERRISALLQSLASSPLGAYTQNVQASLNNLSTNLSATNSSTSLAATTTPTPSASTSSSTMLAQPNQANGTQSSSHQNKQLNQSSKFKSVSITNESSATIIPTQPTVATATTATTISNQGSSNQLHASNNDTTVIRDDIKSHKKLPIVGFLKFLVKSCYKLRPDSLLATTMTHCSQLQTQLTKLYLNYEQTIDSQCLKPIQHIIEIDIPNVIKLRKLFIKSHNDLESVKAKYNGASQKQQQQMHSSHFTSTSYTISQNSAQQANINKLDQLKKELDDAVTRFEQARDTYATELYVFVSRETELVNLFMKFYQYQSEYHQSIGNIIQTSLPPLSNLLASTPRKVVFGTPLGEHLRCTGRSVSLVIELCVHILYSKALNEEGLFRIPGSSVKIKKLKNAINAWFVALASQNELESDQQGTHPSVLAVHDLFKEIVGQRPQQSQTNSDTIASNQLNSSVREDSCSVHMNPLSNQNQHDLVFDVHTIAGLLKLYLRELPEPLFTYALYQQFLDATSKALNDNELEALEQVIQQLPKANYDNLRHLIRFLHLLTCHREHNKMTATNLAITMAPSLIWARPTDHQSDLSVPSGEQAQDEMQSLNLQMSSVGISASLHAFVIENLIDKAEKLFPGPTQFSISDLDEVCTDMYDKQQSSNQDRCIESGSPTGLSTASSSSFSSSSNTSLTTAMNKKHSRKGGSMDGLLGNLGADSSRTSDTIRPVSVQFNQGEISHSQKQPPPIPPAPVARSHQAKNVSGPTSTLRSTTGGSSHKPPAPPIPPSSNLKRQQYITCSASPGNHTITGSKAFSSLVQSVLASPGTSQLTGSTSSHSNPLRPSVPPPSRPQRATPEEKIDSRLNENSAQVHKAVATADESDNNRPGDTKFSHSLAGGGNFRAGFEEINTIDVDDISVPSVSPIVSLDDTVSGDDSSFDNECHSLEHSWTDCDMESPLNQVGGDCGGKSLEDISSHQVDQKTENSGQEFKSSSSISEKQVDTSSQEQVVVTCEAVQDDLINDSPTTPPPPIKPPRSISPKVSQSTPL